MGNLVKLVPSLNEKIPTLNSLWPILLELASSKNNENVITLAIVSKLSQTPLDELILPPVLVLQLQVATAIPSTSTIEEPIHTESTPKLSARTINSEPVSLEMFNKAANDLSSKGIINLKKYSRYLDKRSSKAEILKNHLKDVGSNLVIYANIGPNMATFKFYVPQEEEYLKLHFTFSNLGDLKDQLYSLWV